MLNNESAFALCNVVSAIGWIFSLSYWFQKNRLRGKRENFNINESLIEVGVVFLIVGQMFGFALTISTFLQ